MRVTPSALTPSTPAGTSAVILSASFNQDASCLSVGYPRAGFAIFNCDPFGRFYAGSAAFPVSGSANANQSHGNETPSFSVVEMLFTTSLVALVGAGQQSPRRLQIVNTKRESTICELSFVSAILSVKLNRKRLIVCLEEHIYVYDIANMKLLHTIDTSPNPHALCALSPSSENCYLAYPPSTSGGSSGDLLLFDVINLQAVNIIQAHKSPLSCIAFSCDGTLVATSSDKGTVIRVFSVPTGAKLFQLRRGTYNANIYSIAFDISNKFVCVSSDTDTVHIYKLMTEAEKKAYEILMRRRSSGAASGGVGGSGGNMDTLSTSPGGTGGLGSAGMDGTGASMKKTIGGILGTGFATIRTPLASATSAVSSFLPNTLTEMWEPQRDFAFAKLPQQSKGLQNMCAIIGGQPPNSPSFARTLDFDNAGLLDGGSGTSSTGPLQLIVVSACGFFYGYTMDSEIGGECVLVKEHSLLDD